MDIQIHAIRSQFEIFLFFFEDCIVYNEQGNYWKGMLLKRFGFFGRAVRLVPGHVKRYLTGFAFSLKIL